MRTLAAYCGAFAAGIFLAQYLLPVDWLLPCAALSLALACVRFRVPGHMGRRVLLIGTGLAFAFGWNWLYVQRTVLPARALSGTEREAELILCDYPDPTSYGIRATVRIVGVPGLAVYYGDWADLRPGQVVRDTVQFRDASVVRGDALTAFTSRGVFLLAYSRGTPSVEEGTAASPRWRPLRLGHAAGENIRKTLPGDTAALLTALLTGDRSGLSVQASADVEEAGLSHILAVSGMHCGFLLACLSFLIGRYRRRTLALCAVPVLVFYAVLTGGRPSVVRSCVMLFFLLAAPLFHRENDGPTALSAALFLILLHNPFAAASVSLQLSFASVAGLLWLSPGLYRLIAGETAEEEREAAAERGTSAEREAVTEREAAAEPGQIEAQEQTKKPDNRGKHRPKLEKRKCFLSPALQLFRCPSALWETVKRQARSFLAGSLSLSLGALALTAPLTGNYFGVLSLIAPVSSLLCLWAVGCAFLTGLVSVTLGFFSPALGLWAAQVPALFLRFVLAAAHVLAHLPGHAVYFDNPFLKYWFLYACLLLAAARLCGRWTRRRAVLAAGLLALSLFCTVWLYQTRFRHSFDAVVLDVGQGQSVVLASAGRFALADCGSGNAWYDPGAHAARVLRSMGCHSLDCLLLTHFDADHINGTESLLARVRVGEILVPEGEEIIASLAETYGVPVRVLTIREEIPFGMGTLTVFPPLGTSGDNERGLSLLASAGETDLLITGDMGQSTERKLLAAYSLPDLEALTAGHHGSKTSTSEALLDALTPETVCVSVGSNSYGHPSPETLARLEARGIAVWRTDRDGDIHLILGESP